MCLLRAMTFFFVAKRSHAWYDVYMWHLVSTNGERVRLCSNYYLAQMVADYLKKQTGQDVVVGTIQKNTPEKEFFWDTGSMSLGPTNNIIRLPDNVRFSYPSHQTSALSNFLSSMPPKELFYEFSGTVHTICLTVRQFNTLLDCVRCDNLFM